MPIKEEKFRCSVHNVQVEEEDNEVPPVYTLFNVSDAEETLPPAKVKCLLQGKPFIFEVDSRAPFSLMLLIV